MYQSFVVFEDSREVWLHLDKHNCILSYRSHLISHIVSSHVLLGKDLYYSYVFFKHHHFSLHPTLGIRQDTRSIQISDKSSCVLMKSAMSMNQWFIWLGIFFMRFLWMISPNLISITFVTLILRTISNVKILHLYYFDQYQRSRNHVSNSIENMSFGNKASNSFTR